MKRKVVTIITPFYRGNQFLDRLLNSIEKNASICKKDGIKIQHIIVNDSPEYDICINNYNNYSFDIIILNNEKNIGIQKSRIKGISYSKGEYIIMLDQDDYLEDSAVESLLLSIKDYDVCVGNGYQVYGEVKQPIFANSKYQELVYDLNVFLKYGTVIISPGQCLVKKDAISQAWIDNPININGADDEILWILMLSEDKKFTVDKDLVYNHYNTGENTSDNYSKMALSAMEAIPSLKERSQLNDKQLKVFERRRKMKCERYKSSIIKKIWIGIKYIDLSLYIVKIKFIKWRK